MLQGFLPKYTSRGDLRTATGNKGGRGVKDREFSLDILSWRQLGDIQLEMCDIQVAMWSGAQERSELNTYRLGSSEHTGYNYGKE